jgi:imidazole glycerol phosphate synthase glutamine amidotransferase subunit
MIAIVDYGAGNLRSVENALAEIGAGYVLVESSEGLRGAEKIILPGVGHFGQMMRALEAKGLRDALIDRIRTGVPFLGICLGLQALFESSEEAPDARGLGLLEGTIRRFPSSGRVPHMGWNEIQSRNGSRLLKNLGAKPYLYFAHSYYAPVCSTTSATCNYAVEYTAVLESRNVFGVQFHPEKSGPLGLAVVRNFIEL